MKMAASDKLDGDTFALLEGRKWKSLEADELENVSWFDDLDEGLHKYALVSGESFPPEGREGEEVFSTVDLIADPDSAVEDESQTVILLFDRDLKNAAILTDETDAAGPWLESLRERGEVVICQAFHKVRASTPE